MEFPAGGIEDKEEIITAGERELLEETGYHSTAHKLLYTYNPMNGIANQVFHVVQCMVTNDIGIVDTIEITDTAWFNEKEIFQMIRTNEMQDGYTLTSFLLCQYIHTH